MQQGHGAGSISWENWMDAAEIGLAIKHFFSSHSSFRKKGASESSYAGSITMSTSLHGLVFLTSFASWCLITGQNHSASLDMWSHSIAQEKWISKSVEVNYNLKLRLSWKGGHCSPCAGFKRWASGMIRAYGSCICKWVIVWSCAVC